MLRRARNLLLNNQRGAMTIEYIAIGILSLALIGAISGWLKNSGEGSVGKTFGDTVNAIMKKISTEVGGSTTTDGG